MNYYEKYTRQRPDVKLCDAFYLRSFTKPTGKAMHFKGFVCLNQVNLRKFTAFIFIKDETASFADDVGEGLFATLLGCKSGYTLMELFWEEQKAFTTFPKGLQKITKNVRVISRIDSYNIIRV